MAKLMYKDEALCSGGGGAYGGGAGGNGYVTFEYFDPSLN